jgi:hypothetical protein
MGGRIRRGGIGMVSDARMVLNQIETIQAELVRAARKERTYEPTDAELIAECLRAIDRI